LASIIAGIDDARTKILVHVLDLDDPGQFVAEIKHRYERPLKEIFGC
jgi:multicomponent K+:H+ antiporter subunit E